MINPWKKIKEENYKAGFRKLIKRTFELPDGNNKEFDVANDGNVACCVILTADATVILTKQFRPGPEKVLMELVGGFIDSGESPDAAMKRELLEETGYDGNLIPIGTSYLSAYSTMVKHIYLVKDARKLQEPKHDDEEFMELIEMPLKEFRKHVLSGQMTDTEAGFMVMHHLHLL
ncbi:MAG: NUDIX hydrolase [bacterium]|nr:NUDIX hydrolase [bacterium]